MATYLPEQLGSAALGVKDFTKSLASDIVKNMKGLYQSNPRGFVPGNLEGGKSALLRGYWDSFFNRFPDDGAVPTASRPFSGGQCCTKEYLITFTYEAFPFSGGQCQSQSFGTYELTVQRTGSITAVRQSADGRVVEVVRTDCAGVQSVSDATQRDEFCRKLRGFSIAIAPGFGSDDCGDLPADFPDSSLPASVNPREFTYQPPGGGLPVKVPYSIDFDPTVIVPIVKVDLNGEVSVPVSFDAGGINVDLPDLNIGEGDSGGISPEDLEALLDAASKIPGIQENIQDLVNGGNQTSDNLGEQEGEQEGYVPDIAGLVIQVTGIPTGAGRKFGQPQIFDFGRAHFKRGSFYSSEIPLATIRQWVVAPPDADGYAIYLKPGVTANVTVVKQVKENGG